MGLPLLCCGELAARGGFGWGIYFFLEGKGRGRGGCFGSYRQCWRVPLLSLTGEGAVGVLESSDLEGGVGLSLSWWAMVGGGVCSLGASSSG